MSASGSEVNCFRMPVTPTTVALKTLVFSIPVALRSAVHERQQLRSQLLSSASDSNDSGSEDTCLLSASSSEVSCFQMSEVPSCFDRFRMPVPPRQLFSIVFEGQWLRDNCFRVFSSANGSETAVFACFRVPVVLKAAVFECFRVPVAPKTIVFDGFRVPVAPTTAVSESF